MNRVIQAKGTGRTRLIEGDRCNCDDPGLRGFLISAPIGALAGGIVGAKFLF